MGKEQTCLAAGLSALLRGLCQLLRSLVLHPDLFSHSPEKRSASTGAMAGNKGYCANATTQSTGYFLCRESSVVQQSSADIRVHYTLDWQIHKQMGLQQHHLSGMQQGEAWPGRCAGPSECLPHRNTSRCICRFPSRPLPH